MTFKNLKRSMIRVVAMATISAALLASGGVASAMPGTIGLTACDRDGCTVVTLDDLDDGHSRMSQPADVGFTE